MTVGLFMQALGVFASAFVHSVLAHTFTFGILVGKADSIPVDSSCILHVTQSYLTPLAFQALVVD